MFVKVSLVWPTAAGIAHIVVAISNNEVVECDSQKDLKIIDLTGAGDLFAAGFLHGYINKMSVRDSLKKGTEMASKVIQIIGARLWEY